MKASMKKQPDPKKLMESSERKKKAAAMQESLGKAQMKNKVKSSSSIYPVGKERMDIAKNMRMSAKLDSLASVRNSKKK